MFGSLAGLSAANDNEDNNDDDDDKERQQEREREREYPTKHNKNLPLIEPVETSILVYCISAQDDILLTRSLANSSS